MRLDGVRVLDLTRHLPGPYATQLLADAGAEVVKIEDTATGDPTRWMSFESEGSDGTLFEAVNRGKRSVALDLKSDAGREAFFDLVSDADALIEGSGRASPNASASTTTRFASTTPRSSIARCRATDRPGRTGPVRATI